MNNFTYVCLIRRGTLSWTWECGYTLAYVWLSEVHGCLIAEGGEVSFFVSLDHTSLRRGPVAAGKAAALLMAGRAAAGSQDLDLRKGVLLALLLGTVSHDHQLEGNDR
jgi:hypothetical protein